MSTEETKEQQQIYLMFRICLYAVLIIELIINIPIKSDSAIFEFIIRVLMKFSFFKNIMYCKLAELVLIALVAIGTKAQKDIKFNWKRMVIIPCTAGSLFLISSLIFWKTNISFEIMDITINRWIYAGCSIFAVMFLLQGLDAISKYLNQKVGDDRFNFENESFEQTKDKVETEYSVNIPMIYYFKKKMHKGWINIDNPFRGTIVLGTPGSGKSFGIIDPFIRQHAAKGFTMMVYDYKFPTLAKNLFYQYCKNRKNGKLPNNCKFRVINFTDVEYSSRVNPIQKKYIPDLAAASETAATLLASLNKGGGEKKGGSEAFFTNSAENFLAAMIYYFVNLRPWGFKDGKKLNWFISYKGSKLKLYWEGVDTLKAEGKILDNGKEKEIILDFTGDDESNVAFDNDKMLVDLNEFSYISPTGEEHFIERVWWEDDRGNEVEPDTMTGEYSDMPHVLSLLGRSYDDSFELLMRDDRISSLMAPFMSAWKSKANDQLEGMVGTLRVNAARLVSPEAYWIFTGDDIDLKISDPQNPSYLVIANDPEKEQIIGTLNALVLNRLVTRVNSKGNLPVSLIVDELPTLYFHKIDRLIGTARSNKVAVTLGFQELPQLEADYGKVGMQKIITTCGNIFMGAARNKETLEWAQNDIFGKTKQISKSYSINDTKISTTISEKTDYLVPAAKIADMATGWLAGQAARDFTPTDSGMMSHFDIENSSEFKTTKYFCKTHFDMKKIADEEAQYVDIPKLYDFGDSKTKESMLLRNFKRVNNEIDKLVKEILG